MSKAIDAGKAFLAGVLAKLPENVRGQVETAFNDPQAADALTVIGSGALAQSDINRKYQEIQTQQTELDAAIAQAQADYQKNVDWFEKNNAELARLKALADGTQPPTPAPAPAPASGISKDDLEKYLAERDRSYASVLGLTTTLATQHYKDFGEVLDGNALIAYAEKNRQSLGDAYRNLFAEKIKAKADAEEQARINKQVEERVADALKKQAGQPFPLKNGEASALDVLELKEKPELPDPVAEYNRLQSLRESGSPVPFRG